MGADVLVADLALVDVRACLLVAAEEVAVGTTAGVRADGVDAEIAEGASVSALLAFVDVCNEVGVEL